MKEPSSKLLRWRLKLEAYNYEIIYKPGPQNKVADPLSRIELHVNTSTNSGRNSNDTPDIQNLLKDIAFLNENYKPPTPRHPKNDSLFVNLDDNENQQSDNETIHSNHDGNTTTNIPISETPINYAKNQIIISSVPHSPSKPKIIKIFDKTRLVVQLSENNFDTDIINFIKEFIVPKLKYGLYFEQDIYERFSSSFIRTFSNILK